MKHIDYKLSGVNIFAVVLSFCALLVFPFSSELLFSFPDMMRFPQLDDHWQLLQFWRMVSPIFLHFTFSHLILNLILWLYVFNVLSHQKSLIELIPLVLVVSFISNFSQYIVYNTSNFGGFSGVIYGLFGFCAAIDLTSRRLIYNIPWFAYVLTLIWLLIGFTPFSSFFLGENVSNASHMTGLVSGFLFGIFSYVFAEDKC